jgi:hypothetical protein
MWPSASRFCVPGADDSDSDACVWMINPGWVNEKQGWGSAVVRMADENAKGLLNPYLTGTKAEGNGVSSPLLAQMPSYDNARIRAQRGAFIAFGEEPRALERLIVEDAESERKEGHHVYGRPVVIPRESLQNIRKELDRAGVSEGIIYPDLSGLCKELGRHLDGLDG